jgi:integrase
MDHIQNKNIRDSSKNIYIKNIQRLNDNQEVIDLNFLKNTDTIMDRLKKYKPNSQRTYLISIVSTLKDQKGFEECFKFYYNEMMKLNKELKINNTKSDTQKENWISQAEVIQTFNNLLEQTKPLFNLKKLNEEEYKNLLNLIVLGLYVLQPVRRNKDYQLMLVIKSTKDFDDNYKDYNYWMDGWFLFYNYKTKGTYSLQEIPVSQELKEILRLYIKLHPLRKQKKFPLLVDHEGNPLLQVNSITRILNKIFKKKIGVSMLRNIYLTDKFKEPMQELKDTAMAMGTSSNTIQNNYVKVDDIA